MLKVSTVTRGSSNNKDFVFFLFRSLVSSSNHFEIRSNTSWVLEVGEETHKENLILSNVSLYYRLNKVLSLKAEVTSLWFGVPRVSSFFFQPVTCADETGLAWKVFKSDVKYIKSVLISSSLIWSWQDTDSQSNSGKFFYSVSWNSVFPYILQFIYLFCIIFNCLWLCYLIVIL